MRIWITAMILSGCSISALSAPHPDCKGIYVGKTYKAGIAKSTGNQIFYTVKGIDKDENLVSASISAPPSSMEKLEDGLNNSRF